MEATLIDVFDGCCLCVLLLLLHVSSHCNTIFFHPSSNKRDQNIKNNNNKVRSEKNGGQKNWCENEIIHVDAIDVISFIQWECALIRDKILCAQVIKLLNIVCIITLAHMPFDYRFGCFGGDAHFSLDLTVAVLSLSLFGSGPFTIFISLSLHAIFQLFIFVFRIQRCNSFILNNFRYLGEKARELKKMSTLFDVCECECKQ